ncbi:hypothetical protein [Enterovirga sp. CN4-39]
MYQERYDPFLHADEGLEHGSTRSRLIMFSAVVSGSLLLYLVVSAIG